MGESPSTPLRIFRAALRQEPDDRDAIHGLGVALQSLGDPEAKEFLRLVSRHDELKQTILDSVTALWNPIKRDSTSSVKSASRSIEPGRHASGIVVVMALSIYAPGTQEESSLKKVGGCRHERSEPIIGVIEWLGSEQACRTH